MQTRNKVKLIATAGVLISGMMLNGCGKETKAGVPPQGGPAEVGVTVVQPRQVALTTELSGRTAAFQVAEVRPQIGGIIQKRLFTEGSDVKAGEVLYQIDPASYQAAYASARAALGKAQAALVPVRLKTERFKQLVAINAVSKQDFDDATAALKGLEAEVDAARAGVETARINLAYTRITAPIAGRIGRSAVTPGSLVTAGQATALSTIQQLTPVYVDVTQSRPGRRPAEGQRPEPGEGQAGAGGRLFLPLGGGVEVLGGDRRPEHRFGHPAHPLPQPEGALAAGHVRAGGP
jgi:membrane fusion protein, multidrug efflux system